MSERTFDPTPRHLSEMRRRGDVALSAELTGALALLAAIYMLLSRMADLVGGLADIMRRSFTSIAQPDWQLDTLWSSGLDVARTLAGQWLPFFLLVAGAGIVVTLAQTRGLVSPHRLKPDFSRVNPVAGFKRIFSSQGMFETGKGLLKMAILGIVLYGTVREIPTRLAQATQGGLGTGIAALGSGLAEVSRQAALFLLVAAGIDFFYQFRRYRQRMMMTREEVMEDMKNAEGQPMLRAKIREMQRRMSRRRMMQQIAYADVVVTNPTHLAIALRYNAEKMAAPVVVAKGQGLIAQQIVARAREHRIPIVQNIPLAHALIKLELEEPVPVALYQAVAEVLAFVYRLRRTGGAATYVSQGAAR